MAGQIVKRGDNIWLVRIFLGRDANGKRRFLNKTIHGTKKDAGKFLTAKLREKDLGINIEPASESLGKYLDTWLDTVLKSRVRARTFDDYAALIDRYIRQPLGAVKLSDLRPVHIEKLYRAMLDRGLSPRVVRYTHAVLSSALKHAVKRDMVHRNPAATVDLPKKDPREMKAMTPEEARRFLAAVKDRRLAAMFMFALTTGMRPQEYLALKWSDVDLTKRTATVQRALVWSQKKGGGWHFDEPKTKYSRRTMPLPESTVRALTEHKRRQAEERLRAGSEWQDHGLVFTTILGGPLSIPALTKQAFKPALAAANLPAFRLYDLRHSHATLMLSNGENPKIVSERLGHSTSVLTLDTYSHVLPHMQQQAADRIQQLLFSTGS